MQWAISVMSHNASLTVHVNSKAVITAEVGCLYLLQPVPPGRNWGHKRAAREPTDRVWGIGSTSEVQGAFLKWREVFPKLAGFGGRGGCVPEGGDVLLRLEWCTGGVPRPRPKVLGRGSCQGEWRLLGSSAQRWDRRSGCGNWIGGCCSR